MLVHVSLMLCMDSCEIMKYMILAAWQSDEKEYCTNSTIQTVKIKGISRGN